MEATLQQCCSVRNNNTNCRSVCLRKKKNNVTIQLMQNIQTSKLEVLGIGEMNEDDYDFDTAEKLSVLFGRDYESANSSLIYKAPKQPGSFSNSASSISSKTFHKYIRLYENNDGKLCGQYIIAIVKSELNPEILIYQTKKNIFIRIPIYGKSLYAYANNNHSLILNQNNHQYKLEFENDVELLEFTREFVQNGGLIEEFKESKLYHPNIQNIKNSHEKSLEIDTVREPEKSEENIISRCNKSERSDILTRLEKMGLPQLLPIQKQIENVENCTATEGNLILNDHSVKNGEKKENSMERKDVGGHPIILDEGNQCRENVSIDPKYFITQQQTELLTSLLVDSQRNNSELKEAISLLTLKLNGLIPSEKLEYQNKIKALESKIQTLELRSENLQSELNKCHEKYKEQHVTKNVHANRNTCENSSQTDNLSSNQFQSIMTQILGIIKSLPLNSNEICQLKKIKDEIKHVDSISSLESYFNFIEEINVRDDKNDLAVLRNEFVTELKKIMNNMYQNICSSEELVDIKNLLAKQIKLSTVEILKNYDFSLEQMKI